MQSVVHGVHFDARDVLLILKLEIGGHKARVIVRAASILSIIGTDLDEIADFLA